MAEIKSIFFWRAVLAEFLGVSLYVALVLGVVLSWDVNNADAQLRIALCFGLSLSCISYMFFPSSGGHINPAVTIASVICRRISILRALFYIIVQCGGGAAIVYSITPSDRRKEFGVLSLHNNTTKWQGFALEGLLGFVLSFVFLSGTDPNRQAYHSRPDTGFGPQLAYGFVTIAGHLMAIPYTGCGMNPARALGPAVLKNHWPNYHWIYWAGPIAGAVLAGVFYVLIFSVSEESTKASADITSEYIIERPAGLEVNSNANKTDNKFAYGDNPGYATTNI